MGDPNVHSTRAGPAPAAPEAPEGDAEPGPRLSAAVRELRSDAGLDALLDLRVMAAVRATAMEHRTSAAGRWRRSWAAVTTPRAVRVSPLQAALVAAGLAALLIWAGRPGSRDAPGAPVPVRFVVAAPAAARVSLVGDFNAWDAAATPLAPTVSGGVWTVTVLLRPGRHEYAFMLDGTSWMPDPAAPAAPVNEFGPPNSVVLVAERS